MKGQKKKRGRQLVERTGTPNRGVLAAIQMVESQTALADILNVSQPAINYYLYEVCPIERAIEIERKLGIPKSLCRPDVFDQE